MKPSALAFVLADLFVAVNVPIYAWTGHMFVATGFACACIGFAAFYCWMDDL